MLFKVAIYDGNLPETSFSEMGQFITYICLTMPKKLNFKNPKQTTFFDNFENVAFTS